MPFVLLFFLLLPSLVYGQAWNGLISSTRATDWTYAGVTGGITNRTTICQTIPVLGTSGSPASPSTIDTAIWNCSQAGGGVVKLSAGTYYLSGSISFGSIGSSQNVTLRGAGPDQTILVFKGQGGTCDQGGLICMAAAVHIASSCSYAVNPNTGNWINNYSAGSTTIILDNVNGNSASHSVKLARDMYLILDQQNSPNTDFALYRPFITDDATYQNHTCASNAAARCVGEFHKVTNVAENTPIAGQHTITITPPIAYQYWNINGSSTNQPRAWWCLLPSEQILNDGVEDLTIDYSIFSSPPFMRGGLLNYDGAFQSWHKNVATIYENGVPDPSQMTHVHMTQSAFLENRDSYHYGMPVGVACGAHSTQYGFDFNYVGYIKVENNILQQVCSAFVTQPCYVCVIAYNFTVGDLPQRLDGNSSLNGTYAAANYYVFWSASFGHGGGNHNLLAEGNDTNAIGFDHQVSHGSSAYIGTLYRNYLSGTQVRDPLPNLPTPARALLPRIPLHSQALNRLNNFIGNVLGDSSLVTAGWTYKEAVGTGTDPTGNSATGTILAIGWAGGVGPDDQKTTDSTMLWGNYDYKTANTRWCGNSASQPSTWVSICSSTTEIPSDNIVPASLSLPSSLYLSSKPSWFGSRPYPPIGPDVTSDGLPGSSTHVSAIPAKYCYLVTMGGPTDGSGNYLTFNANTCYAGTDTTPPSAPQNLRIQ